MCELKRNYKGGLGHIVLVRARVNYLGHACDGHAVVYKDSHVRILGVKCWDLGDRSAWKATLTLIYK